MVPIGVRAGKLDCQGLKHHNLLLRTLRLLLLTIGVLLPVSASLVSYPEIGVGGTGKGNVGPSIGLDLNQAPAGSTTASGVVCWGITAPGGPLGDVYGDACNTVFGNLQDNSWSHTRSPSDIGILNPFNLAIVFDASEPGNVDKAPVTVWLLQLNFWDPISGDLLYTADLANPVTISTGTQGAGRSGHVFGLDWTQATEALAFIGESNFPTVRMGLGAELRDYDGHAYFWIGNLPGGVPPQEIPEPATFLMIGGGLLALGFAGRRFRRG